MPPRSLSEQVKFPFLLLPLTKRLTALQPLQAFRINSGAVPYTAPKQRPLVVTLGHLGTDVRDEVAGVDTQVDEMQRASHLVEFAVI